MKIIFLSLLLFLSSNIYSQSDSIIAISISARQSSGKGNNILKDEIRFDLQNKRISFRKNSSKNFKSNSSILESSLFNQDSIQNLNNNLELGLNLKCNGDYSYYFITFHFKQEGNGPYQTKYLSHKSFLIWEQKSQCGSFDWVYDEYLKIKKSL